MGASACRWHFPQLDNRGGSSYAPRGGFSSDVAVCRKGRGVRIYFVRCEDGILGVVACCIKSVGVAEFGKRLRSFGSYK